MIEKNYIDSVEGYFGEKVTDTIFMNRSSISEIFLLQTEQQNQYILKKGVGKQNISTEYLNHEVIYNIWYKHKENLSFHVPSVYIYGDNYYVMEYVENSIDLQKLVFKANRSSLEDIFFKTGRAFYEYHEIVTPIFIDRKESSKDSKKIRTQEYSISANHSLDLCYTMPEDSYKFLLKDATPSNVLIDNKDRIWFIDFQNIYHYASFYYDIARFIDTLRIFSFVRSPIKYLFNRKKIANLVNLFIEGYDKDLSLKSIDMAREKHQKDHVTSKKIRGQMIEMLVWKTLYKFKI